MQFWKHFTRIGKILSKEIPSWKTFVLVSSCITVSAVGGVGCEASD